MRKKSGALPSQELRQMVEAGIISGAENSNIRPASFDLTASEERYRGLAFALLRGEKIRDLVKGQVFFKISPDQPLEPGVTYLIRLREKVDLRSLTGIYAFSNPKSSVGRINFFVRLIVDYGLGGYPFDHIPAGYEGELWAVVTSNSFLVEVPVGCPILQARFFDADTRLDKTELELLYSKAPLLYRDGESLALEKVSRNNDGLILSLDLNQNGLVYRARFGVQKVINLNKESFYRASDFFEMVEAEDSCLTLIRGNFYLLSTKEFVIVPPDFAAELVAVDPRYGDLRSHYAGFGDPNFQGTFTLEICPFESNFLVRDGQLFVVIRYERVREVPDILYGTKEADSHYTNQKGGPKLSKNFIGR